MPFDRKDFDKLFSPRHIALIGASTHADKVGYAIVKNILDAGYKGQLFPVNPSTKQLFGIDVYPDIKKVKKNIDLAIIAVNAGSIPQILEDCNSMWINTIIIISAGFKETSTPSGELLEEKLIDAIKRHKLLVVGPNCLGIVNTSPKVLLNATFARIKPRKGKLAFISQSGAIGIHALEFATKHDIGFSKFITIGNKSAVDENDLIEYLYDDPETDAILLYLESFADGLRFREVVKKNNLTNRKPIVLLKSGRTESGKKAALSHTGAMAGEDGMTSYFLEDCKVIRTDTMQDMFTTAMVMSNQPVPAGDRLMIMTNAGGLGIMAVDAAEKYGLQMAAMPDELRNNLKKFLPRAASINNPVDILGDADAGRYLLALKALLTSDVFDMLLIICTPQFMTNRKEILDVLKSSLTNARKKGITTVAIFPSVKQEAVEGIFDAYDLPNYEFPEQAVKALSYYTLYANYLKSSDHPKFNVLSNRKLNHIKRLVEGVKIEGPGYLNEVQSYELIKEYGISIADSHLVSNYKEAVEEAKKMGFPLAAKIVADGVLHKYDIGGVILNIANEQQLITAYHKLVGLVKHKRLKGVLLQKMVAGGIELIMGAKYHRGFGHAIMFGLGGTYVEIMEDVTFGMVPLSKAKASEMVESIKGAKLLNGYRSKPAVDKGTIVEMLTKLSQIVVDFPEITSLDLNPVFATEKEVTVADARVIFY